MHMWHEEGGREEGVRERFLFLSHSVLLFSFNKTNRNMLRDLHDVSTKETCEDLKDLHLGFSPKNICGFAISHYLDSFCHQ